MITGILTALLVVTVIGVVAGILLALASHFFKVEENETVKAQVIYAFAMLAVLKKDIKILDRAIVEPLISSANSNAVGTNKSTIQDAIDDINHSLNWNI